MAGRPLSYSPLAAGLVVALLAASPAVAQDAVKGASAPVQLGAAITMEAQDNLQGGLKRGALSMYNLDLTADWQGRDGWEAYGYVLVNANGGFSGRYSGDVQTVSNIDAVPGTRLFEAWVRKTSADQRHITTFGLINLNGIFDVQSVGGVFLNASSGIGPDYSQSTPSIFPVSGLGLVSEWHATKDLTLRGGIFDGVPGDPAHDSIFTSLRLSARDGANVIAELEDKAGGATFKLGAWTYTAKVPRWDGQGDRSKQGIYAHLAVPITSEAGASDQGLSGWLRAGVANGDVLRFSAYAGGGLVYTGLFPGHDEDQAGLAISHVTFSKAYRAANPGRLPAETDIELTYQLDLTPGLKLQPDIQYIRHPGGDAAVKDALVIGLRLRARLYGNS